MKRPILTLALPLIGLLISSLVAIEYPQAVRETIQENYHGTIVSDPYRWLEDSESPKTQCWINQQRELFSSYINSVPERELIEKKLVELWNYETRSIPEKHGEKYYWFQHSGLQNQAVLVSSKSFDDSFEVVLDPNEWSEDGTTCVTITSISPSGEYLAYLMSENGSDSHTLKILDLKSGRHLEDTCIGVKFSELSWMRDSSGLFYSSFRNEQGNDSSYSGHKIFYHQLNTPQSQDRIFFEPDGEEEALTAAKVTEDGEMVVIVVRRGGRSKSSVLLKTFDERSDPLLLVDGYNCFYEFVGKEKNVLYFQTNDNAPLGKVVAVDLSSKDKNKWKEIIPEQQNPLSKTTKLGNHFFANYLEDVSSLVKVFDQEGELVSNLALPGIGMIAGFESGDESETFYTFTNHIIPCEIHRFNLEHKIDETVFKPSLKLDLDAFATERVFCESGDGTPIPLFISYKKGALESNQPPTLLYGYGGFALSNKPNFKIPILTWMDLGGVYVSAHIRGGDEYGETWHQAGMIHNKQNVFDDFIAAAEFLIDNRYTTSKNLGILGASNGGLLVAACMNQRPELFGACSPAVGVLDMIRFPLFTIGWSWMTEYGSPQNPEEFSTLLSYSPYHNLRSNVNYPPCLVLTANCDDRVVPAHSYKYVAALQNVQKGNNGIYLRVDTKAGHGQGKGVDKLIAETADRWAFFLDHLGKN